MAPQEENSVEGLSLLSIHRPYPLGWPECGGGLVFVGIRPPIDSGKIRLLPAATTGLYEAPVGEADPKPPVMQLSIPDASTFEAPQRTWKLVNNFLAWRHDGTSTTTIARFTRNGQTLLWAYFLADALHFDFGNKHVTVNCASAPKDLAGIILLTWSDGHVRAEFAFRQKNGRILRVLGRA
jgi:hypothetical protein